MSRWVKTGRPNDEKNFQSTAEVYVRLLSRIGAPIDQPLVASSSVLLHDGVSLSYVKSDVEEIIQNELANIEMVLARWDIVTIASGTLKEGSYEGKNGTVKTMTITTYPNQIYIVDAKRDGKGLKYPIKKSAEVEVADNSDMPF